MAIFNSSCADVSNFVQAFSAPEADPVGPPRSWLHREFDRADLLQDQRPLLFNFRNTGGAKRGRNLDTNKSAGIKAADMHPVKSGGGSYCVPMHGDLFWFEHLHIIPTSFDLGNVLTTQEREYEVFNAYRTESHLLSSIVDTNYDGFSKVGEPSKSPNLLGPKTGFVVTVTVSPNGPVTIAARTDYVFGGLGVTKTVTFTGARVIIMTTPPESQVTEGWEWVTDVIQAASGDEQRISVRDVPRQTLVYRFIREDRDLAYLVNQLWGWHENVWALPVWTDYTLLSGDISTGVLNFNVEDTTKRDFRVGELCLLWDGIDSFEAVEVASFTNTNIACTLPTILPWSAGTFVLPMHLARLNTGWKAKNYNIAAREIETVWTILNQRDFSDPGDMSPIPLHEAGFYRNLPIWDIYSDYLITSGTYSEEEKDGIKVFPDKLGKISAMTVRDFPQNKISGVGLQSFGRDETWRMRSFLHALRGRQKAFWMSTGRDDFTVESTVFAPATEVNVNIVNYTNIVDGGTNGPRTRRNIVILYKDGTKDYRRILSSLITPGVREVLSLDSAISQDWTTDNVERISYVVKRRLGVDKWNIEHEFYEGEASVNGLTMIDVYDGE